MGSDEIKEQKHKPKNHSKSNNVHYEQNIDEYINESSNNQNNINQDQIEKDNNNYNVKYTDVELNNVLINSMNSINIKESIFGPKEGNQDPVFHDINEKQKVALTEVFKKYQHNYSNELNNYLNQVPLNVEPSLVSNLIQSENGYPVYTKKVLNEISKINDNKDKFKIKYLTVIVIGKTGVGKSTLINCILNLKGDEKAPENSIDRGTLNIKDYQNPEIPYLRLVDTRGLELGTYNDNDLAVDCQNFIDSQLQTKDMNNFIHCIWYCLTGARLEKVEIDTINALKKSYKSTEIPIIVIYTQAMHKKLVDARLKDIKQKAIANDFVPVLARDIEIVENQTVKSYGLDVLLQKTLKECKEALNGRMHYVMTKNISDEMNDNLVKENAKIKNYIKEKNILDFTQNYDCNDESEFQNYITDIYGKNINCFLNRELSNNGKNIIANSNLMKHNNNYIKYYQERKNIIISKELEALSIKGLIFQASTEKKKRNFNINSKQKRFRRF